MAEILTRRGLGRSAKEPEIKLPSLTDMQAIARQIDESLRAAIQECRTTHGRTATTAALKLIGLEKYDVS